MIAAVLVGRHWLPRAAAACLTALLVAVASTAAFVMNLNVFVYLLPVLWLETYRLSSGRILHFDDLWPAKKLNGPV